MRARTLAAVLTLALAAPLSAQGFINEMHDDATEVQKKLIALAKAFPENMYSWTPGTGVRTVGEVLLHVAGENYFIPVMMGKPAPAASGITSDFKSTETYEKRKLTKAQIVAELEASFGNLHQGLAKTTDANSAEKMKFFGQDFTRAKTMVLTVTHLHEHLGQLVAYARMNKVVPPWSK